MRHVSIRHLLVLSVSGVLCATLLLAVGWLLSLNTLQNMKQQIFIDASSLQASQSLELALSNTDTRTQRWDEAARLVKTLPDSITSPAERPLVQDIENRFNALMRQTPTARGQSAEMAQLMNAVHVHRALNEEQMSVTVQAGQDLEHKVRSTAALVFPLSVVLLGWGSFKLWTRIVRPTLELSRAATAFGRGEHEARSAVLWDDEMGALCRTFNDMAQNISEREKERLDFVAAVAHDLKTPLVVIDSAANLMQQKQLSSTEQERWLKVIVKHTRSLEGTIADLSNGVQAQTGRLELHREVFDLSALATEIVRVLNESDSEHILNCECSPAAPIMGDRARIERVVQNLLSNAMKYSPRGGEVRLVVETREKAVLLRVEDDGIGIAPEEVPRVFEPFQRLAQARIMATGTGMGLASARKIIEAHGGMIRIMSQPQHGTTVEVRLPCMETEETTGETT